MFYFPPSFYFTLFLLLISDAAHQLKKCATATTKGFYCLPSVYACLSLFNRRREVNWAGDGFKVTALFCFCSSHQRQSENGSVEAAFISCL